MKIIKMGGHKLFKRDQRITDYVSKMLFDLEKWGMDSVRQYSMEFDNWNPPYFDLSIKEINHAISQCDEQLIADTEFCQNNVRDFAQEQLTTLLPLETEIRPGVILGHKHIPVGSIGSYVSGSR